MRCAAAPCSIARFLEQLMPSAGFEMLKSRTLLEEDKAVIAALVLGEQVLELVRSEKLINRREMLDLWDLKHQEENLAESAAALKNAVEVGARKSARSRCCRRRRDL